MKHLLCLVFALAVVGSADSCRGKRGSVIPRALPVAMEGPLELRLMSFNIRYENSEDWGARVWKQRIAAAVHMVMDESPDVLGVQEALHGQVADLRASLPAYDFFGVGRDNGGRAGEYSGIFFRRDRFMRDESDSGTFWLSDTPEKPGSRTWGNEIPRLATWVRLVDRATQRGFYVFNTHWDHRNQVSRERAALLIARRIDARKRSGDPVVLSGDFNAVESNPAVAYLTGAKVTLAGKPSAWSQRMVDAFQSLHRDEAARTTLHFWEASRAGRRKVDHLLVSPGARILEAAIRDQDKPPVSDHFPVTARVVFP